MSGVKRTVYGESEPKKDAITEPIYEKLAPIEQMLVSLSKIDFSNRRDVANFQDIIVEGNLVTVPDKRVAKATEFVLGSVGSHFTADQLADSIANGNGSSETGVKIRLEVLPHLVAITGIEKVKKENKYDTTEHFVLSQKTQGELAARTELYNQLFRGAELRSRVTSTRKTKRAQQIVKDNKLKQKTYVDRNNSRRIQRSDFDVVAEYMRSIGRNNLLTKDDEVELAERIQAGEAAKLMLEMNGITDEEKVVLVEKILMGYEAAQEFEKANYRLVVSIAKKYQNKGLDFLDLVQEGNIGLRHAIKKFDHRKGFKFSTYSTWWIRQHITRAIVNYGSAIRLPNPATDDLKLLKQLMFEYEENNKSSASVEDLAEATGWKKSKIITLLQASQDLISLEKPIGDESEHTLNDVLGVEEPGFKEAENRVIKGGMLDHLSSLDTREREILILRLGLDGSEPQTLEQVGKRYDLTRERIRQIENRALAKLKHPAMSYRLKEYYAS